MPEQDFLYFDSTSLPRFLFSIAKEYKWTLLIIALVSVLSALDKAAFPYFTKLLTDAISINDTKSASLYVLCFAFVPIAANIVWRIYGAIVAVQLPKIQAQMRLFAVYKLMHQSNRFFVSSHLGDLNKRIIDMPNVFRDLFIALFENFSYIILSSVSISIMICMQNLKLGLLFAAWIIAHYAVSLYFARRAFSPMQKHYEESAKLQGDISDILLNIFNIRLFAKQDMEMKGLGRGQRNERSANRSKLLTLELFLLMTALFSGIVFAVTMYLSFQSLKSGHIDLSTLVLIMQSLQQVTGLFYWMSAELPEILININDLRESFSILQHPVDIQDAPNAKDIKVVDGEIKFENVDFSYTGKGSDLLFHNKNISIEAKSRVAVVGESGSGKTTFVYLIIRNFDPISGSIKIDGQDIKYVTQKSLRESIVFVPQEPILFHRTVMENLRFANEHATDEDIIEASKNARCHEFITNLKDGYAQDVGERGTLLSGGQRQRIMIARAMLKKKAKIVVLDEATSALDIKTEALINEALDNLMADKTVLVVAHRLSTIRHMDRILVFKGGDIVEDGKHEDLLAQEGYYASLFKTMTGT